MRWDTGVNQDRDGYWVVVDRENTFDTERFGPFLTEDGAKAAERKKRLELHLAHGPGGF